MNYSIGRLIVPWCIFLTTWLANFSMGLSLNTTIYPTLASAIFWNIISVFCFYVIVVGGGN